MPRAHGALTAQEDEDSDDLDFLADSDGEEGTTSPDAAAAVDGNLYQQMHSRVLQRLMGGAVPGGPPTAAAAPELVTSADAFSFDADAVLADAQKEVRSL